MHKKRRDVIIVYYRFSRTIWGVFSTEKKANKALKAFNEKAFSEFYTAAYEVDYRSKKVIKYAHSSKGVPAVTLADIPSVPIVDLDTPIWEQPVDGDNHLSLDPILDEYVRRS